MAEERRDDLADAVEGEAGTWTPPTDPVVRTGDDGRPEIVGGFSTTSMDRVAPRSTDDAALEDAVRRELREDAATAGLTVAVAVRDGVAYLRGTVEGPEDADAAEEVAGRVNGLREVVDQLEVPGL